MRAVTWLKLAILLALLGCGWLFTVRAQQVSAENRAHTDLLAAQKEVRADIGRAAAAGLTAQELAPFRQRAAVLEHARPPSSLPVLSSSVSRFYAQQARALRILRPEMRQEIQRVTRRTRSAAHASLEALKVQISRATALDADVRDASHVLTVQTRAFQHASLPRDFRLIPPALSTVSARLATRVRVEAQYVSRLLAAVHGQQQEVLQQADMEAAAVDHPLTLLGLITPRAEQYRLTIRDMLAAVQAAPSAFDAAVKESHLHSELARVNSDYAQTVPARMIVVSTEEQTARLYQDGSVIYSTPVTTGGPDLPTDHGVFHIYWKQSPFTFHSPWPPSSPYYYPPTEVQYWMPFYGGEGLHDASWRSNFGPGSNFAPTDLGTGNTILGTHGCVNLPFAAAQLIWDWAPVGTMVVVV